MFQRRIARTAWQSIREAFWPSMGWRRAFLYVRNRLIRLSDSNRNIALGLAFGASMSFSPLVGIHFVQAGILAYLFRANILASTVGTFVGNPWTFPLMWGAAIALGNAMLGVMGIESAHSLPETITIQTLWDIIRHEPLRIFLPWALGGYTLVALSIPFYYAVFYAIINTARKARMRKNISRQNPLSGKGDNEKNSINSNSVTNEKASL